MILQTSRVIPLPGNWGRFHVRKRDRTAEGLTSARSGQGVWQCTPGCLRALLAHAQFDILDERFPPLLQRKRYPWYLARCHTA